MAFFICALGWTAMSISSLLEIPGNTLQSITFHPHNKDDKNDCLFTGQLAVTAF